MAWPKGMKRGPKPKVVTEWPENGPGKGDVIALNQAALSGFDYEKFGAAIAFAIKEGNRDHAKEKRDEQHRLRMRKQFQDDLASKFLRWKNCSHMRSHPYSGTSRIAWATQSDGITRGTCMHCECPFSPIASELPFPEMVEWYKRMIAVPMTAANNDFVTGMVAAGNPA